MTRWDSKWSFLDPIGGIDVALTAVFGGVRPLVPRIPAHAISLPDRSAHRCSTETTHRHEFNRRISEDLEWLGASALLLTAMTAVAGTTNNDSVSVRLLAAPTALCPAVVLGYFAYMMWGGRYRVPQ